MRRASLLVVALVFLVLINLASAVTILVGTTAIATPTGTTSGQYSFSGCASKKSFYAPDASGTYRHYVFWMDYTGSSFKIKYSYSSAFSSWTTVSLGDTANTFIGRVFANPAYAFAVTYYQSLGDTVHLAWFTEDGGIYYSAGFILTGGVISFSYSQKLANLALDQNVYLDIAMTDGYYPVVAVSWLNGTNYQSGLFFGKGYKSFSPMSYVYWNPFGASQGTRQEIFSCGEKAVYAVTTRFDTSTVLRGIKLTDLSASGSSGSALTTNTVRTYFDSGATIAFPQWTAVAGNSTTLHFAYRDFTTSDLFYNTVNMNTGSLGTEVKAVDFSGSSVPLHPSLTKSISASLNLYYWNMTLGTAKLYGLQRLGDSWTFNTWNPLLLRTTTWTEGEYELDTCVYLSPASNDLYVGVFFSEVLAGQRKIYGILTQVLGDIQLLTVTARNTDGNATITGVWIWINGGQNSTPYSMWLPYASWVEVDLRTGVSQYNMTHDWIFQTWSDGSHSLSKSYNMTTNHDLTVYFSLVRHYDPKGWINFLIGIIGLILMGGSFVFLKVKWDEEEYVLALGIWIAMLVCGVGLFTVLLGA